MQVETEYDIRSRKKLLIFRTKHHFKFIDCSKDAQLEELWDKLKEQEKKESNYI